jgi:excisionase family DNA binding protein
MVRNGQGCEKDMMLLTVQDVAEVMRISEKTVRRLIKRGDLVAYKVGDRGQLRVNEHEVERYLESQRVQTQDPELPTGSSGAE